MASWDRRLIISMLIAAAVIFGLGYKYGYHIGEKAAEFKENIARQADSSPGEHVESQKIYVYVVGEVLHPGVYEMQSGDRVFQVMEKAQPTAEADLTRINLAEILEDQREYMVSGKQAQDGQLIDGQNMNDSLAPGNTGGKVNINTAGADELAAKVPGIGPTLAARIIDYRKQNGPFRSVEQIKEVPGIGEKRFEQMRNLIVAY